ncbi:DUF6406 domain-containing protein [Actinoallomurus iriomotensis]|uniref:Uncharacterized protein n=1 Tax=Actinoallomurus iriomotensis TaxID=478107 RepID=A0A9W6RGC3_9ACTN|nr:hypothetical protein Airi01_023670 [Actinoallomurus iriomotensis]
MSSDSITLRNGLQANVSIGSFAIINVDAREGHPLVVRLGVVDDEEHRYNLHPGDTFPVRDQTWKLDRVENPGSPDWTIVLTRVE